MSELNYFCSSAKRFLLTTIPPTPLPKLHKLDVVSIIEVQG
jgi:hypothetical protein